MEKYRHEYKYRLDAVQAGILEARASMLLWTDKHVEKDDTYVIKSLYFDDCRDSCFFENENGVDDRAKFRIRYYNDDLSYIRLEKKSKRRGMTLKESCIISEEQCRVFMEGLIPRVESSVSSAMQKMFTEMQLKGMQPKIIVIYERKPLVYPIGNVRVTFDRNILSSNAVDSFLTNKIMARPILAKGESILEVKWDELLPDHISNHLALESLQWSSFSKYYLCRKYDCYGGLGV